MSELFANRSYINEDGSLVTMFAGSEPSTLNKQLDKDIYDSGVFAGIKLERERVMQILNNPKLFAGWSDHGFSGHGEMLINREQLIELIKGENK